MKGTSGKEEQYITLIDGFAGGGIYAGNKFGSPITILKAVEEAEAKINLGRENIQESSQFVTLSKKMQMPTHALMPH